MRFLKILRYVLAAWSCLRPMANAKFFDITEGIPGMHPDKNSALLGLEINRQHSAIFNEAIQLLNSIKSSPSCNRVAATRLVAQCQSLGEDSARDPEANQKLDVIRSVYAARLAICELDGAGAAVPSPCLPLTSSLSPSKGFFGFRTKASLLDTGIDAFPKEFLEPCLKALESRAQWWTSYSNNKQNAIIICQATRLETEKEELLNLHQSIIDSNFKLNEGLHVALQKAAMESQRNEAFLQAVHELQERLITDMEKSQSIFQDVFNRILADAKVGINSAIGTFASSLGVLRKNVTDIGEDFQQVSLQVETLKRTLQQMHEDTVDQGTLALQLNQENSLAQQDLASDISHSLETLMDKGLAAITRNMMEFDKSLEWLAGRLGRILEEETEVAKRLEVISHDMELSEEKAKNLHKAQQLQADAILTHAKSQGELQLKAQISQALLEQTTKTAADLQSLIHDTASKAKQIPSLQIGGPDTWSLCFILFIIITASQRPIIAVSIFFLLLGHSFTRAIFPYMRSILPLH